MKQIKWANKELPNLSNEELQNLTYKEYVMKQHFLDLSERMKGDGNIGHLPHVRALHSKNKKKYYENNPGSAEAIAANARKGLTEESRKQQGESMKEWHETAIDHKEKIRNRILGDKNPAKRPEVIQKRNDTFRTTGRMFIELNSKSFGYVSDMVDKFQLRKSQFHHHATNESIAKRGECVGLIIRFYDENIHPPFSELNDIRKIKK